VVAAGALLAACSSSSKSPSTGGGGGAGTTYKIGILIDETGLAAGTYATTSEKGVKAAFAAVNAEMPNGAKLTYVTADTQSTPAGALSAAQSLVQQQHVFAILPLTSAFFGAQPYLTKAGVPVVGPGIDGPEWFNHANTNLFNTFGEYDENLSTTAYGTFMKAQGVTTCGSIGSSNIPSVTSAAKGFMASCKLAGLKTSTISTTIPYGGTDIGAIALQMKADGVNGLESPQSNNTAYALVARLKQLGVKLKVTLIAIGYGSDTLNSPAAVAAAQGLGFTPEGAPIELNTPGAQKFKAALVAGGITEPPTYPEQVSYQAAQAFLAGFQAANKANVSQQEFMTALRGVKNFDAAGELAPAKIDFSKYGGPSMGGCIWPVKLTGNQFVPFNGIPVCGTTVTP
jgi:branched-chain amino acid transport system substrate-binding protein